jgi:hypothetical protein
MWSDAEDVGPSAAWVELPENGWGALMEWVAGRGNLGRRPSSDTGRTVTGTIERAGEVRTFEEPFTAGDRQGVDDHIDMYLREAGLPPRPRGYIWMIRVPGGYESPEAFLADADSAILRATDAVSPKQLLPIFEAELRSFYKGDVRRSASQGAMIRGAPM